MLGGTCGYFSFILSSQAFLPGWRNRRRSSRHPAGIRWGLDVLLCSLYRFVDSCPDGGTDEGAPAIPPVYAGGWMYFYVIYTVLLIPARMAEPTKELPPSRRYTLGAGCTFMFFVPFCRFLPGWRNW